MLDVQDDLDAPAYHRLFSLATVFLDVPFLSLFYCFRNFHFTNDVPRVFLDLATSGDAANGYGDQRVRISNEPGQDNIFTVVKPIR